jgi:tRNA G18 (ribose-2'-O)-methylase SpoU
MSHLKTTTSQLNRLNIENFKLSDKYDIYIILDQLRSGNNIGSIFRTSDAFKLKKIFITGQSAIPPNKEILKTALGATETVDWEYHENAKKLVQTLKDQGIKVFAIEQAKNSTLLQDFKLANELPLAIILGNEVDGVQQELIDMADGCIEIPQFGTKHSLNVSVTSGIVIWHLVNQLLCAEN